VLREYVSVQRATAQDDVTSIGDDCLLLAYVHVAHDCVVGNGVTMSNLVQLAGHCTIGDHAGIGGMVGMHQFVRVGKYAFVGGYTKLGRDLPPFFLCDGNPAKPYGLNSAGLKRAGFSAEEMAELKRFYRLVYGPNRSLGTALEEMRTIVTTHPGRDLIAFLQTHTDRGILK